MDLHRAAQPVQRPPTKALEERRRSESESVELNGNSIDIEDPPEKSLKNVSGSKSVCNEYIESALSRSVWDRDETPRSAGGRKRGTFLGKGADLKF